MTYDGLAKIAEVGAGVSAVFHLVVPDEIHARDFLGTCFHLGRAAISQCFLSALDDAVTQIDLVLGIALNGTGMAVGGTEENLVTGDAGLLGDHIAVKVCIAVLHGNIVHGVDQDGLVTVGGSDAGGVDVGDKALGLTGLRIGVAGKAYTVTGSHIDLGITDLQTLCSGCLVSLALFFTGAGASAKTDGHNQRQQ